MGEGQICKISDFQFAHNLAFEHYPSNLMFGPLIPPECLLFGLGNFSTKGDVYFFGWILIELIIKKEPVAYSWQEVAEQLRQTLVLPNDQKLGELIFRTLQLVTMKCSS